MFIISKLLNPSSRNRRSVQKKSPRLVQQRERRERFAGDVSGVAGRGQDLLLFFTLEHENALRIAGQHRELRIVSERDKLQTPDSALMELDEFSRLF